MTGMAADISKCGGYSLLLSFFLLLVSGCASHSHTPAAPIPRAEIKHYTLDFEAGLLLGTDPTGAKDKPASSCTKLAPCFVFEEDSYKSLRRYNADLEEELRACQAER